MDKIKDAKSSCKSSSSYDLKSIVNHEHTRAKIVNKNDMNEYIIIKFKSSHKLTIFEAGTLFMVFVKKEKPRDYAAWYKTIAGQKFFDNIEEITLFDNFETINHILIKQKEIVNLLNKFQT